jgi:MoxR-like ATPase
MTWGVFAGDGIARPKEGSPAWAALPKPPPWRRTPDKKDSVPAFDATQELVEAVNASLLLRRPLLLTGLPGSGKSTLVDLIAAELEIGPTLRWHITSKSLLNDGLFLYDALARLQAIDVTADRVGLVDGKVRPDIQDYVTLGPLGTALASSDKPRAVLIDEIDKSDLDLPGDLLNVLEEGYFDIPPLVREGSAAAVKLRGADRDMYEVQSGRIEAQHFPVIVMTSNGERAFPPPFLRRCIRYTMPTPDKEMLARIVALHLGMPAAEAERVVIEAFAAELKEGRNLAVDQLLSLVHLVTADAAPGSVNRERLRELLLRPLSGR